MDDILTLIFLQSVALVITAAIIPGLRVTSIFGPILMVIALSITNKYLWDQTLFQTIPHEVTYNTLKLLFANGLVFWVLVKLLPGIEIEGILPALVAPILLTFVGVYVMDFGGRIDWVQVLTKIKDIILGFKVQLLGSV